LQSQRVAASSAAICQWPTQITVTLVIRLAAPAAVLMPARLTGGTGRAIAAHIVALRAVALRHEAPKATLKSRQRLNDPAKHRRNASNASLCRRIARRSQGGGLIGFCCEMLTPSPEKGFATQKMQMWYVRYASAYGVHRIGGPKTSRQRRLSHHCLFASFRRTSRIVPSGQV